MKILIACEFSGVVREAFTERGHDAMSCDLLPTEQPGQHYQGDVFNIINDGWDMMIAHPPCTFLSSAGLHWNNTRPERKLKTIDAFEFFMNIINTDIDKIAVENPVGYINTHFKKPQQIINPCDFGEPFLKKTCLWLKGLPPLAFYKNGDDFGSNLKVVPTHYYISSGSNRKNKTGMSCTMEKRNPHERSKTFQGIADAMADQWG